jgi:uncharacterized membrane protein YraQ (UPF0718 family)
MARWGSRLPVAGLAVVSVLAWLAWRGLAQATPGGPLGAVLDSAATFATVFLGLFIEAAPFLLLGTLASGLVEVFVSRDQLDRLVPRDPARGAIMGAVLGMFFPVCECGVVPLTRRLFHKGLPLPAGIAFLLAAPVFNPIVILSTLAAFGAGRVLALRLGLTLVIAILTGLAFSAARHPRQLLLPAAWPPAAGASGLAAPAAVPAEARPGWRSGLVRALTIAVDEFFEMGRYLVIGGLLAALMQTAIPQPALLAVSAGPVRSVVALVVLAVVLSVCSTVDAFIALSFAGTFPTGAIVSFLVFGPMVDIKSVLMFLGIFRRRAVVYLVLLPLVLTIVAGVALNLGGA